MIIFVIESRGNQFLYFFEIELENSPMQLVVVALKQGWVVAGLSRELNLFENISSPKPATAQLYSKAS